MATLQVRANTVLGFVAVSGCNWVNTHLALDGAYGTTLSTYAYWQCGVANAVGTIDIGFGSLFSSGIPAGSSSVSVAMSIRHSSHATRVVGITMGVWDGTTLIGTQPCTINSADHVDTHTFTPTAAQLRSPNFMVRMTCTRYNSTGSSNYFIDHLDASVTYTAGPTGPAVTVWNGTAEVPAGLTVWNGSSEVPAAVSEVLP